MAKRFSALGTGAVEPFLRTRSAPARKGGPGREHANARGSLHVPLGCGEGCFTAQGWGAGWARGAGRQLLASLSGGSQSTVWAGGKGEGVGQAPSAGPRTCVCGRGGGKGQGEGRGPDCGIEDPSRPLALPVPQVPGPLGLAFPERLLCPPTPRLSGSVNAATHSSCASGLSLLETEREATVELEEGGAGVRLGEQGQRERGGQERGREVCRGGVRGGEVSSPLDPGSGCPGSIEWSVQLPACWCPSPGPLARASVLALDPLLATGLLQAADGGTDLELGSAGLGLPRNPRQYKGTLLCPCILVRERKLWTVS